MASQRERRGGFMATGSLDSSSSLPYLPSRSPRPVQPRPTQSLALTYRALRGPRHDRDLLTLPDEERRVGVGRWVGELMRATSPHRRRHRRPCCDVTRFQTLQNHHSYKPVVSTPRHLPAHRHPSNPRPTPRPRALLESIQ